MLLVMVQRPGRSNGVANGVRTSIGWGRRREWRWDAGDSVGLSVSGTWVDRYWVVRLLAALVETVSRMELGTRSGGAVDRGHQAADDCVIVVRLREEPGNINNGRHSGGAGVGGDGARWLLRGGSVRVAVGDHAVLLVMVQRPGRSNGVANGVRTSIGWGRRREWRWDAGDSVGLSVSGTWVDRYWVVRLLAALVETVSRMELGTRSGGAVDRGHQAADDSVGRLTCEAAGRVSRNGVTNGVGNSVGWRCRQDGGRRDANDIVGQSASGHWLVPWSFRAMDTNGVGMPETV